MRNLVLIIFLLYTSLGYSQTKEELRKIDKDYNTYLNSVYKQTFKIKKQESSIPENFIFGTLGRKNQKMAVTNNKTFSVSFDSNQNKLIAAILHGVKHFSTYEFLADDYEQINGSKDFMIKEYLRLKVHVLPDTGRMKILKSTPINELENINIFSVNGYIKPNTPYVISYFKSHQETGDGMNRTVKMIISQNGKTIYSSNKIGSRVIVKHETKINDYNFVYKSSKGTNHLVSGGLMNHVLDNTLNKIKDEKHLNAKNVSNVTDYYNNQNKDLKRVSNNGKLSLENNFYENILEIN